jgi:hypothetical protein
MWAKVSDPDDHGTSGLILAAFQTASVAGRCDPKLDRFPCLNNPFIDF